MCYSVGEDMEDGSCLMIRHASGRQNAVMVSLLTLPLLLALIQPITSQQQASNNNLALERMNQTQKTQGFARPTSVTKVPRGQAETGVDKIVSAGVSDPEAVNNIAREKSTNLSKTDGRVELTTSKLLSSSIAKKDGFTQPQWSTVPTPKTEGHSTTKTNNGSTEEDFLKDVVSTTISQTARNILTTVSNTHIKQTADPAFRLTPSTAPASRTQPAMDGANLSVGE